MVHRWTTKSEYYDIENGEEISKQLMKRDYIIIRKTKTVKIENENGKTTIINECRKRPQYKLW